MADPQADRPVRLRALRGATQLAADDKAEMQQAVGELVTAMLERNGLTGDDLVSMLFTATPDLHSQYPALAARELGLAEVPLLCAQEMSVPGSLPRVVRILAHVETTAARSEIRHVYLRGAEVLRPDLPH